MGAQTRKLTMCALVSAIGVMIMLLGGFSGVATYAAPLLSGFVLIPIIDQYGLKYSLACWVVTGALAIILISDKELALFYTCVIGWYTCIRPYLQKLPVVLRWIVKAAIFNADIIALYAVIFAVIGMKNAGFENTLTIILALVLGNALFIVYDLALSRLSRVYILKLRSRIFSKWRDRL